jgi:hypothetical protein
MKETIYFTLITNKYLSHAKVLFNSFSKYNEGKLIIGLIDKLCEDLTIYDDFEVIQVEELDIAEFGEMKKIYNVIELLTACKPFYFKFLMDKYPNVYSFVYLDSDMKFFSSLNNIIDTNKNYDVLLTPHFLSPQPDDKTPSDHTILSTGIFNLGFICINRTAASVDFNNWWCRKLIKYCFADIRRGYFTDQLWVNFAPSFLPNFKVIRNLGMNVSNWNLHERMVVIKDDVYLINENERMIFYHFSNFQLDQPNVLSWYNDRYNFSNRPEMYHIFEQYINDLVSFGYNEYKTIPWAYENQRKGKWYIIYRKVLRRFKLLNSKA